MTTQFYKGRSTKVNLNQMKSCLTKFAKNWQKLPNFTNESQ